MRKINKSLLCITMAFVLFVSLCSCGKPPKKPRYYDKKDEAVVKIDDKAVSNVEPGKTVAGKRNIIIDTDTGADDASALILAARQSDVNIVGVTVLLGNVDLEQSTKNAIYALDQVGCDAPVFKGSSTTYDGTEKFAFSVFGEDGMGDADLIHPSREANEGDAVDFIINTVKAHPGEIELIALGPATNIARAIDKDPETMKNVKRIWSMGSAGLGAGNASPVAEFNVYGDAEAYDFMLDSGIPITIIGLDMCGDEAQWTDDQFVELSESGEVGDFVAQSFGKIREFYKGNGSETVMNCDSLAMMCALYPDFINEKINTHASCIIDKGETYGEVIFYKEGFTYDAADNDFDYNVELVTDVDKADYFNNYLDAVSGQ